MTSHQHQEPGTVPTENYILRIYRRDSQSSKAALVGTLEEPASGQSWTFRTVAELNQLLSSFDHAVKG